MCRGCEQKRTDGSKSRNRFLVKARNAINTHAKRLGERWGLNKQQLIRDYGWRPYDLAHDLEHGSQNGCPCCRKPFSEMGHGLADLSFDIINPAERPYYRSNVKISCLTCNKEKQQIPPDQWGQRLRDWELFAENEKVQIEIQKNIKKQKSLFDE